LKNIQFVAKTFYGLEEVLASELREISESVEIQNRAVLFTGNLETLYRANIALRTALTVLMPIDNFKVINEDDLYQKIKRIDWIKIFDVNHTFSVDSVVYSKTFTHSKFIALKTKDAIVDLFREKLGKRPDVNVENPDIKIHIHISENHCSVLLDSSGISLHKRGYRTETLDAPLNEVLAAGMVYLSGWDKKETFIDPMCGSGTIPIEAAMIAANIPPNIDRRYFCFQKWKDYDESLFEAIKTEYISNIKPLEAKIYASDNDPLATRLAKNNLSRVYNSEKLEIILRTKSFIELEIPYENGILIMNPPFGERLKQENISDFYNQIGTKLKHDCAGYKAWILSANFEALKCIGLKPSKKKVLYNGALECKFQQYELFKGKRKDNLEGVRN